MVEAAVAPNPVSDKPNDTEPMQVSDSVVVSDGAVIEGALFTV